MVLSVVVPTLNGREQLARTLDSLAAYAPDAEVVVVNGPSTDGTTGMVQDREDVDVLVEVADRTVASARNAGIEHASGGAIALVDQGLSVTPDWRDAVASGLEEADAVTGPVHQQLQAGMTTESADSRTVAGREVTLLNGGNVAFDGDTLDRLDGFDERLDTGSARDCAHRLAGIDGQVAWRAGMGVERAVGTDGDRGTDPGGKYAALAYRLAKNHGLGPRMLAHLLGAPCRGAVESAGRLARGEQSPSTWFGNVRDAFGGLAGGATAGLWARTLDRSERRNPYGTSSRSDRAVAVYDWR